MVYRLIVSYRGAAYAGWQWQRNALAVQEVLEAALAELIGGPVRATGASRTDAGVHARGQAVHLDLASPFPLGGLVFGTNSRLPEDVRVLRADRMPDRFHARRSALAKEYSYRLSRVPVVSPLDAPFVLGVPPEIDLGRLREATALLPGRHDFTAFALAGGSHRRGQRHILSAGWEERGEELCFRVVGDGFLRGMVRVLAGTLIEVGLGRRSRESLAQLLQGRPRQEGGPTAPAHALVLERVLYGPEWQPLPAA